MQQSLPPGSPEVHGATSTTVRSLMEKNIIPLDTFVQTFLHTIIVGTEHRDLHVADAWVGCLLEVIPLLPLDVLQNDVTPVIIKRAVHEKPLYQRVSSCRIIGALCTKYPDAMLKRELLPSVLTLCQDIHADVRTEMAQHLPAVFQSLGSCIVEQLLMPLVIDLASEEMAKVKEATLQAIVNSMHLFSDASIQVTIIPLLKQIFDFALENDHFLLLAVIENFGKILMGLERVYSVQENDYFLNFFLSTLRKASDKPRWFTKFENNEIPLSTGISIEIALNIRKQCAYNLGKVMKFGSIEDCQHTFETLHNTLKNLISDHCWEVRKAVADSLPEVLSIYGKHTLLLKDEYVRLLSDEVEDVLGSLVPKLASALVIFAKLNAISPDPQDPSNSKLLAAIKHCEDTLLMSFNWRLHCTFIQQMEVIWSIFPPDVVFRNFISTYLQRIVLLRALPLRLAYVRTVLINSKFSPNHSYQNIVKRKMRELMADPSFYNRMLYLRACYILLEVYSKAYFKQNFFMETLKLSDDPVPNIRWALCKLIPQLHSILSPLDKNMHEKLKDSLKKFENDKDKEVKIMLTSVKISLESPDGKAYADDIVKEDEETIMNSLSPRLIQNFPFTALHLFDHFLSTKSGYSCEPYKNNPMKKPDEPSCKTTGLNDKDFLVDAGVPLKSFTPLPVSPSSTSEKINSSFHNVPDKSLSESDGSKVNQNESKSVPQKKLGFRHSIPIRKKIGSNEPDQMKIGDSSSPKSSPVEKVTIRKSKIPDFEKRKNQNARNPGKRYSLDVMSAQRSAGFNPSCVESISTDNVRNNYLVEDNALPKGANVDINKNLTKTSSTGENVLRRKKSQLPRPLSCVVLPVKNDSLEKTHLPSRLPIMRRT